VFTKLIRVFLIFIYILHADSLDDDLKDLRKGVHDSVIANTNALMIFTSQDMISSGQYKLTGSEDDIHVRITSFPFLYHFENQSFYNFFVLGGLGRSVMQQDVTLIENYTKDESEFETYVAKIGGGIRVQSDLGFEALVGVSLIYSRIYNTYKFKSEISDIYKKIFEDEFANKSSDNISYDLFIEFAYRPNFDEWKPYVVLNYNYYDTKSFTDIKDLEEFTTQSSVVAIRFGMESAPLLDIQELPLTLEAYASGNIVSGDMRSSLDFEGYGEWGVLSNLYIKDKLYPITKAYIGYSEVHGDGINGYNIGFGVSFSF